MGKLCDFDNCSTLHSTTLVKWIPYSHELVAWSGQETFSFYFYHSTDQQWTPHPLPIVGTHAQQLPGQKVEMMKIVRKCKEISAQYCTPPTVYTYKSTHLDDTPNLSLKVSGVVYDVVIRVTHPRLQESAEHMHI